jgi:dethiobiotin synthase
MTGYFVTGTGTDVGKTVVCAWLMLALDGEYWKPVQAGLEGETDEEAVRRLTGLAADRFHPSVYRLKDALSPHEAARREGVQIEMSRFALPARRRPLIVEGAGGIMVPLNERALVIDLIVQLGLPVILVARSELGTINHSLLSLEALRARRVAIAGVVVTGPPNAANSEAIASYGKVPIIAEIPVIEPLERASLAALAARARPKLPESATAR